MVYNYYFNYVFLDIVHNLDIFVVVFKCEVNEHVNIFDYFLIYCLVRCSCFEVCFRPNDSNLSFWSYLDLITDDYLCFLRILLILHRYVELMTSSLTPLRFLLTVKEMTTWNKSIRTFAS